MTPLKWKDSRPGSWRPWVFPIPMRKVEAVYRGQFDSMSSSSDDTPVPPEPSSSPAPAAGRGLGLWTRLKALLRPGSLREDLEELLETAPNAATDEFSLAERAILQNVLKLGETRVDDVMVPRTDIVALEASEPLSALLARFLEAGHSRLPIYAEDLDDITGFVHVKDALRRIVEPPKLDDSPDEGRVKVTGAGLRTRIGKLDIVREALFVPPSMPVGDLLQQMQARRVHMAIVIDEYGGTDGLVTIEDLLEAVVGEEFNAGELADEVDTIGGLVVDIAGHVPQAGEVVKGVNGVSGFSFEILASDGRQILKLKIKRARSRKPAPRPPA